MKKISQSWDGLSLPCIQQPVMFFPFKALFLIISDYGRTKTDSFVNERQEQRRQIYGPDEGTTGSGNPAIKLPIGPGPN